MPGTGPCTALYRAPPAFRAGGARLPSPQFRPRGRVPPGWRRRPSSSPAVSPPAAASPCSAAPSGRWWTRNVGNEALHGTVPGAANLRTRRPPPPNARTPAPRGRPCPPDARTPAQPGRCPSPPPATRSGVGQTAPPRSSWNPAPSSPGSHENRGPPRPVLPRGAARCPLPVRHWSGRGRPFCFCTPYCVDTSE